jgi:glycerophosphoryl diester phosphodiesterase
MSSLTLPPWPYPRWIAHRGAGKLAPENTLAAFRLGGQFGYRAFECDVKLSADDIPFLMHDATLERTTAHRGAAGERSWSDLSRIDAGSWHSRQYAGEPPPSLEAVAQLLRRNEWLLDLEIKPSPGRERYTGEVVGREVLRLWHGATVPPLFTSFRPEALEGAQTTAPQIPRGLLLDTLWSGWMACAQALQCQAVVTNYQLMSAQLLDTLHGAGMRALVYTVNDESVAQWLLSLGIDGIITDAVDRFSPH